MAHPVTLIRGDGIGPEVVEATVRVLEATGVQFEWDEKDAGEGALNKHGTPLPDDTLESCKRTKVVLKGPLTTPVGGGFRSINVGLRMAMDLYANVRPAKTYKGVRSRYDNIDLIGVRENTEDLYAGIEFEEGSEQALELIDAVERLGGRSVRKDSGLGVKVISVFGSRRVVKFAFDYARQNGRKKVTAVHKSNIMKFTDGLFLRVASEVAKDYPDIEFEERIVDNMAMQLVSRPHEYDVIVYPNLYGDILTDLSAGLVGGLGIAAGANIGENGALFEAVHGSAPKYTGQNKVNPAAMIFAGILMLRHLRENEAADLAERATADVIAEGKAVTYDFKDDRNDPTAVGTSQMADAIIARVHQLR